MRNLFKTSEVWVALLAVAGQALKATGILPAELVDQSLIPMCVYIIGRVSGKAARAVIK